MSIGIPIAVIRGPIPATQAFIVSQILGTPRADNSGEVGFAFTPSVNMTVTALGRWVISGNSGTHVVTIQNVGGGVIGSVNVDTSLGTPGGYFYVDLASPISLSSGVRYLCLSQEPGGDQWYSSDTVVTPSSGGSIDGSSFSYVLWQAGAISYVPPNFRYH